MVPIPTDSEKNNCVVAAYHTWKKAIVKYKSENSFTALCIDSKPLLSIPCSVRVAIINHPYHISAVKARVAHYRALMIAIN